MFENIVKWKLLKGSHDFPGKDGGTCINEAAIVAAGFEYKEVKSAADCPPCFSRPIAAYAIRLNDRMPDQLRQKLLMPFVMRLAGTADTREIEAQRVKFMAIANMQRILSLVCERKLKRHDFAEKCRMVKMLADVPEIAQSVKADAAAAYAAADAAAYAAYAAADAAASAAAYAAADAAAYAAYTAYAAADAAASAAAAAAYADAAGAQKEIYIIACGILDEAILMGKHTELDVCEVVPRLEKAKCRVNA